MTKDALTQRPDDVSDVAVVGAGPVGLLLAAELAGAGIRTVVLDKAAGRSDLAKANGVVGRSAVDLARRGILADTGLRVVTPPRFPFGPLSLDLGIGPRAPLHILPVPQRRLEELLEARAVAQGAVLHRAHELVALRQDADGVDADIRGGGRTATVRARYLVGCDGARSFVRAHTGIGFPGIANDDISWIARVRIPRDAIAANGDGFDVAGIGHVPAMRRTTFTGGGLTLAAAAALDAAAPADTYVISASEPRGEMQAGDDVGSDELRDALARIVGVEFPFTTATDVRRTVGNSRHADAYRVGRVLLAGDAAHIFNAGGAALNAGIQDALDLAPRLRAVLTGEAPASSLDAYEAGRRAAVEQTLSHTRVQAALARDDETGHALRDVMGTMLEQRSAARAIGRLLEDG